MRSALAVSSLLLALALSTALVGCKGNTLEGKWNATGIQNIPPGSTAIFDFKGGNSVLAIHANQPQVGEFTLTISGPYKVEGEKLTIDPQSVELDDSKITNPKVKALIKGVNIKEQILQSLKENNVYTVKFDSSDQALLTAKEGTTTLIRVK